MLAYYYNNLQHYPFNLGSNKYFWQSLYSLFCMIKHTNSLSKRTNQFGFRSFKIFFLHSKNLLDHSTFFIYYLNSCILHYSILSIESWRKCALIFFLHQSIVSVREVVPQFTFFFRVLKSLNSVEFVGLHLFFQFSKSGCKSH